MKTMTCPKCDGNGYINAFDHVAGGVCFRCMGAKVVPYRAPAKPKAPPPLPQILKLTSVCGGIPTKLSQQGIEYLGLQNTIKELCDMWNSGKREIERSWLIQKGVWKR